MIGKIAVCLILGYAFGCFSTGYFVGKLHHIDIRQYGSGNAGTTNALRTLGKRAGAMTFLGDILKCIIPILFIRHILFAEVEYLPLLVLYTAVGVVLGHNYPFYLHFKGGKGIATAVGGVAAIAPLPAAAAFVVWLAVFKISGYVSLGSIVAAVALPVLAWALGFFKVTAALPWSVIGFFALLGAVHFQCGFVVIHSNAPLFCGRCGPVGSLV